jgi:hypothetical protein
VESCGEKKMETTRKVERASWYIYLQSAKVLTATSASSVYSSVNETQRCLVGRAWALVLRRGATRLSSFLPVLRETGALLGV